MFGACIEVIGRPGQLNLIEHYVLSTNGFMGEYEMPEIVLGLRPHTDALHRSIGDIITNVLFFVGRMGYSSFPGPMATNRTI